VRLDDKSRDQAVRPRLVTTACTVHCLGVVDYPKALETQRLLAEACRRDGCARLLLLEHPPTYTLGVRGQQEHLLLDEEALAELGATVYQVHRGGDVTFHGPGQLVGYPILNLERWNQGPVWYVRSLEAVLIDALATFGINAQRVPSRPGVWVAKAKIAAIGVRISRGITSHGFALNVNPDLAYFSHIIPCGLEDAAITSMAQELGWIPEMNTVMEAVIGSFARVFPVEMKAAPLEAIAVGHEERPR
jgi:lipoyl(octanoyl) transferase